MQEFFQAPDVWRICSIPRAEFVVVDVGNRAQ